ncbi:MAG TPA: aminotransferase class III-fold pyridoxal phosphate-dependent enzyme [Candidatus Limnocylindrales bacterium]|nr:aminotransferase class III-fold pyridoxal phosphate-dependent enzyme [Candidatus Limnocylindrales bacterium]
MGVETAPVESQTTMSSAEIEALSREHTLFPWSAQGAVAPIAIDRAEGVYLYTPEGRRILDFNSQLMSVNIGHSDRRVIDAITAQATKLQFVQPNMVTEARAVLGQMLAERLPGDIDKVFFTLGGAEANENAIKLARQATGRHKIAARYRSYHGATAGVMTLTGDPRRIPNEPGIPGVFRIPDFQPWGEPEPRPAADVLRETELVLEYEGPKTVAAIIVEPVVGTNGILIPPDGYMQGLRELCDRYGIVLIADEVMAGFGRTGEMFAVNHWDVVPDILTMAKGLTSSYLPLGAVGMRSWIADHFEKNVFFGGLTYNSHPVSCAAAIATLKVYDEDGLVERARSLGPVLRRHLEELRAAHPSVGAIRNIGLFGVIELVRSRDPYTPMTGYNGTSDEMKAVAASVRDQGMFTMFHWNSISTNPPLIVTEEQLDEGFAIIDRALVAADEAVTG